jgi:hypothetical protein
MIGLKTQKIAANDDALVSITTSTMMRVVSEIQVSAFDRWNIK